MSITKQLMLFDTSYRVHRARFDSEELKKRAYFNLRLE